jgi:hypothetical protein
MDTASIAIRPARRDDFVQLWKVASLDSALVPAEPLLVAQAGDEIVAALSLTTGEAIADPFRHSAEAVALLRLRALQVEHAAAAPRRSLLRRLRDRATAPLPAQ